MTRFDDNLPSLENEVEFRSNILAFPPTDALRWEVDPDDGTAPYEIDLTEFSQGNNLRALTPRPELIRQIAPAIRLSSRGRPVSFKYDNRSDLTKLWAFLDSLVAATSRDVVEIGQFSNAHGALLKRWLLQSAGISVKVAGSHLAALNRLISSARDLAGIDEHALLWPNIQQPRGTIHRDVDQNALSQLYRHAKELHRGFRAAELEGKLLIKSLAEHEPIHRGLPRLPCTPAECALLASDFIEATLADPKVRLRDFAGWSFFNQEEIAAPKFVAPGERRPSDAIRWFAPAAEDTMAAFVMVLQHTGWNPDTVWGIDISEDGMWCDDRIERTSHDDKNATVAIYGLKGKVGKEQIAFSLKQPWSHPYQILRYMIRRTAPLRARLKDLLSEHETTATPTLADRKKAAHLRQMIKSPWLYIASRGDACSRPAGRISILSPRRCHQIFEDLRQSAARSIPRNKSDEERARIEAGLEKLTMSDARDGFAAFIYDNSLYNVLLLKHALGHKSIRATKNYLRQRNQIFQRFSQFTHFQDVLFDEIRNYRKIDPTVLFIRSSGRDITPEQRARLADQRWRTRMGMGCLDPTDPPKAFTKGKVGQMCRVQRCTLCRHGVIFEDSIPGIAIRQAELSYVRSKCSSDNFENSTFSIEWAAIRILIDDVLPDRREQIEALTAEHLAKLREGSVYLFDQNPAAIDWVEAQ